MVRIFCRAKGGRADEKDIEETSEFVESRRFGSLQACRRPSHLDALLVESVLVKVEDGRLDGAGRGQHGQADVDGVAPLGIQHDDLLTFAVRRGFLGDQRDAQNWPTDSISSGKSLCGRVLWTAVVHLLSVKSHH